MKGGMTSESAWLLSFGDLLTLILCFFLALVTTGAFSTVPIARVTGDLSVDHAIAADGPSLASREGKVKAAVGHAQNHGGEVEYFLTGGDVYSHEGEEKLLQFLAKARGTAVSILIEACAGPGGKWEEAARRALQVRQRVVGQRKDGQGVSVRVLGEHCEVLGGSAPSDTAVRVTAK